MSWQLVHLSDVAASPWRNGGGVTRELVAWPDSQNWTWRLSVAQVERNGPFSRLPGVQRWFAVLGGAGVRLAVGERTHDLTRASAPFCFDGAAPVDCQLLAGPTQDFNLMLRRGHASARMVRISGAKQCVLGTPKTVGVYAIDAPATVTLGAESLLVPANSLCWQTLGGGAAVQVQGGEALWLEMAV